MLIVAGVFTLFAAEGFAICGAAGGFIEAVVFPLDTFEPLVVEGSSSTFVLRTSGPSDFLMAASVFALVTVEAFAAC